MQEGHLFWACTPLSHTQSYYYLKQKGKNSPNFIQVSKAAASTSECVSNPTTHSPLGRAALALQSHFFSSSFLSFLPSLVA